VFSIWRPHIFKLNISKFTLLPIFKHKTSHEIVTQIEKNSLSTTNTLVCIPFEMSRTPDLTQRIWSKPNIIPFLPYISPTCNISKHIIYIFIMYFGSLFMLWCCSLCSPQCDSRGSCCTQLNLSRKHCQGVVFQNDI
jgi:hypothetical protein